MAIISEYFDGFAALLLIKIFICRIWPWIYRNTIGPFVFGPKIQLADYGRWAVVTGATNGIGKAYANYIAKFGLNVILIAEHEDTLDTLASQIENDYKVQTKTILVDFTDGQESMAKISDELKDLEIGILVNCVDECTHDLENFADVRNGLNVFKRILQYNIEAIMNMCYIILPKMIQNQSGIILNLSSIHATTSSPLLAAYGASKAFVLKFTADLALECQKNGIIVQAILPGCIKTNANTSAKNRSELFTPTSEQYVESAMKTIGHGIYTHGYWPHAILRLFLHEINFYSTTLTFWIMFHIKSTIG